MQPCCDFFEVFWDFSYICFRFMNIVQINWIISDFPSFVSWVWRWYFKQSRVVNKVFKHNTKLQIHKYTKTVNINVIVVECYLHYSSDQSWLIWHKGHHSDYSVNITVLNRYSSPEDQYIIWICCCWTLDINNNFEIDPHNLNILPILISFMMIKIQVYINWIWR